MKRRTNDDAFNEEKNDSKKKWLILYNLNKKERKRKIIIQKNIKVIIAKYEEIRKKKERCIEKEE